MKFEIVGLKHNYYKEHLDELFDRVKGCVVVLSVEEDNPVEANAVAATLEANLLGRVITSQRADAVAVLSASEDGLMTAVVTEVDREHQHVYVEVEADEVPDYKDLSEPCVLTSWEYQGPQLLKRTEEQVQLPTNVKILMRMLKANPERWTDDMDPYLKKIERCLTLDISGEMDAQCRKLDEMLTALSARDESFRQAELRLQHCVREICSDQGKADMAAQIRLLASGNEMKKLRQRLGDQAVTIANQLPQPLISEMHEDLGLLLARIRYWRQPLKKVQQVRSLLALWLSLEEDGMIKTEDDVDEEPISEELLDIAAEDTDAAAVVVKMVGRRQLKKNYPELYEKMYGKTKKASKKMVDEADEEDWSGHALYKYLSDKSDAARVLGWLHVETDDIPISDLRLKLRPLRALCECEYFTQLIPIVDYNEEYGVDLRKNSYSRWMGRNNNYEESELENAILGLKKFSI